MTIQAILYRTVLRQLAYCERILAEHDSPLAKEAYEDVHNARLNVETLQRIDGHSPHVLGNRAA